MGDRQRRREGRGIDTDETHLHFECRFNDLNPTPNICRVLIVFNETHNTTALNIHNAVYHIYTDKYSAYSVWPVYLFFFCCLLKNIFCGLLSYTILFSTTLFLFALGKIRAPTHTYYTNTCPAHSHKQIQLYDESAYRSLMKYSH